jgi:hypothetical protein
LRKKRHAVEEPLSLEDIELAITVMPADLAARYARGEAPQPTTTITDIDGGHVVIDLVGGDDE